MKSRSFLKLLGFTLTLLAPALLYAQEVKMQMHSLYEPFRELQVYMAEPDVFQSGQNEAEIKKLLSDLRLHFHTVEEMPSRYRSQPGFEANVKLVSELLDDSEKRLNEGKKAYVYWRLRSLPGHCFGCHSTYQVSATFKDSNDPPASLDALKKARFLLATRQLPKAREALVAVIQNPTFKLYHMEALRSLLVIFTRIQKSPNEAIETFSHLLSSTSLAEHDQAEVQAWISSLKRWSEEKTPLQPSVENASKLLNGALKSKAPRNDSIDTVAVLRGTALLHKLLEEGTLKPEQKSEALYLLGASYARLPNLFTGGWPEMYLEACIEEFPNSSNAKKSYAALKDYIDQQFTGSAGTDVPADIKLHLDELKNRANGIPGNTEKF